MCLYVFVCVSCCLGVHLDMVKVVGCLFFVFICVSVFSIHLCDCVCLCAIGVLVCDWCVFERLC